MITLKQNLRLGEKVYREFRKEFPALKSNTFVETRRLEHIDDPRYAEINSALLEVRSKYSAGIVSVRRKSGEFYDSVEKYVENLKTILAREKYANCGENAELVKASLAEKGKDANVVSLCIRDSKTGIDKQNGEHCFAVFGLKPGAILASPKTWGGKAVVVDPWANIVMQSRQAIEYFKDKFKFDPQKHIIEFRKDGF